MRNQELDLEASPVHVIGFADHWKYSPGTSPTDLGSLDLPGVLPAPVAKAPTVAVIDTGLRAGRVTLTAASSTLRGVAALSVG